LASVDRHTKLGEQRQQVVHSIGPGADDDNAEREDGQFVLEFQPSIHRHQHIDLAVRTAKKLTVLDAGPSQTLDRQDDVIFEPTAEVVGQILVKQDPHASASSPEQAPEPQLPVPA
jgi:hypothetical protein